MESENQSKSLYDRHKNGRPWEESVPSDLIAAVKSLRERFSKAHRNCGLLTQILCFANLHSDLADYDEAQMYIKPLMQLKVAVGAAVTARFNDLVKLGIPSAIFKAYFDIYVEGVRVQALENFDHLREIGRANKASLGAPYLEWAEAQTQSMIRNHIHTIESWVREVCDKHIFDPAEDIEEQIFWRKWKAPLLIIMKPAKFQAYDPASAWERADAETSSQWLQSFAMDYLVHVEAALKRAAGEAALQLAKQEKVEQQPIGSTSDGIARTAARSTGFSPNNVRREAHKLETQAMYESWQKEYRRLQKRRPNESDVWYSRQIARLDIARESSPETIRKHMKK